MNLPFDDSRAPGQRERGPNGGFIALQLRGEGMKGRLTSCRAPRLPRRGITFLHHAVQLSGQFYTESDRRRKGAAGFGETLL
jgi:hypothetical protein